MGDKIKALLSAILTDLKDTWNRSKIWILGILAIIVTLEFRQLKEYLLLKAGQSEIKTDNKVDAVLGTEESKDNQQADQLVKEAQNLPSQETPVTEDWYKKDQK